MATGSPATRAKSWLSETLSGTARWRARPLNQPVINLSVTPSGKGYWLLGKDGGVFSFGDAGFFGSTGNMKLNQPAVGMTATSSGQGYWFVASDGGVFAFGDAQFYGSMGGARLNKPVAGLTISTSGNGYRMVGEDGGIFSFGDAHFLAAWAALHRLRRCKPCNPPAAMVATSWSPWAAHLFLRRRHQLWRSQRY